MKTAIIGGGLAGSALGYLLHQKEDVTLFEKQEPSASQISSGLLHKFGGLHAKKNLDADEGYESTISLLNSLNPLPYSHIPIIRIPSSPKQLESFQKTALAYPETKFINDASTLGPYPPRPCLLIQGALIDSPLYLSLLKKPFKTLIQTISHLDELAAFDRIIIASGSENLFNLPQKTTPVKGQLLEIDFSLPHPITANCYLIPFGKKTLLGATYEKNFPDNSPCLPTALEHLTPPFHELFPNQKILSPLVRAGIRASTPNHLPLIEKLSPRLFRFVGLGSKGLLYHALYAKRLINMF